MILLEMEAGPFIFLSAIAIGVIIIIFYFFLRWIFEIKKQLWNQKQQINLLILIAMKLVDDESKNQISAIWEENNKS
jgi:uncharacterized membrane protein required for colicin V production